MNTTLIITQILGTIFIVLGLAMVVNKKYTAAAVQDMMQIKGLLWLCGFMATAMGAIMIAVHNVWTTGLPLLITVMGWMALVKGLFILLFPNWSSSFYKKYITDSLLVVSGVVCVILGLALVYLAIV